MKESIEWKEILCIDNIIKNRGKYEEQIVLA